MLGMVVVVVGGRRIHTVNKSKGGGASHRSLLTAASIALTNTTNAKKSKFSFESRELKSIIREADDMISNEKVFFNPL